MCELLESSWSLLWLSMNCLSQHMPLSRTGMTEITLGRPDVTRACPLKPKVPRHQRLRIVTQHILGQPMFNNSAWFSTSICFQRLKSAKSANWYSPSSPRWLPVGEVRNVPTQEKRALSSSRRRWSSSMLIAPPLTAVVSRLMRSDLLTLRHEFTSHLVSLVWVVNWRNVGSKITAHEYHAARLACLDSIVSPRGLFVPMAIQSCDVG